MKTKLREMRPADVPAVLERLREQNERDGTSYGMDLVFDPQGRRLPNIVLALVAVTEDGEVRQGHVWAKTLEQTTFGIDPEATVCSMHEQDAVFYLLRERGYVDQHILVPVERAPQMEHGLNRIYGMHDTSKVLKHFYRRLDAAENADLAEFYKDREDAHESRTTVHSGADGGEPEHNLQPGSARQLRGRQQRH
jgi:hypothetical protein